MPLDPRRPNLAALFEGGRDGSIVAHPRCRAARPHRACGEHHPGRRAGPARQKRS